MDDRQNLAAKIIERNSKKPQPDMKMLPLAAVRPRSCVETNTTLLETASPCQAHQQAWS
jgi:hypothetical protein